MNSLVCRVENAYGFLVFRSTNLVESPSEILSRGFEGVLTTQGRNVVFKENKPANLILDGDSQARTLMVSHLPKESTFLVDGVTLVLNQNRAKDWHDLGLYFWLIHS